MNDKRIPEMVISGAALSLAVVHMLVPDDKLRIDTTTLAILAVAAVPWLSYFLKSLKLPGGAEVEFRDRLQQVEKKVDVIEDRGQLPGRPEPVRGAAPQSAARSEVAAGRWNTDPNKGSFGGRPEANGRVLKAKIEPAAGYRSAACNVLLTVGSTNPERPLDGVVTFHLHPTFGSRQTYDVPVVNGVASDKITSWGVFTVGAEADGGATRLELDLSKVDGGTPKFYTQ